jgi:alpha-glucosidase
LIFRFLVEGAFTAQILKDGPNADRVGTDYLFETIQVTQNSKLTIKMVNGGGFVISVK